MSRRRARRWRSRRWWGVRAHPPGSREVRREGGAPTTTTALTTPLQGRRDEYPPPPRTTRRVRKPRHPITAIGASAQLQTLRLDKIEHTVAPLIRRLPSIRCTEYFYQVRTKGMMSLTKASQVHQSARWKSPGGDEDERLVCSA